MLTWAAVLAVCLCAAGLLFSLQVLRQGFPDASRIARDELLREEWRKRV
jgi:hypothetical protein